MWLALLIVCWNRRRGCYGLLALYGFYQIVGSKAICVNSPFFGERPLAGAKMLAVLLIIKSLFAAIYMKR